MNLAGFTDAKLNFEIFAGKFFAGMPVFLDLGLHSLHIAAPVNFGSDFALRGGDLALRLNSRFAKQPGNWAAYSRNGKVAKNEHKCQCENSCRSGATGVIGDEFILEI